MRFKKQISRKKPSEAPLVRVEDVNEKPLKQGEIEKRNKTFESRMEKTEKSIESLLKILVEKR